MDLALEDCAAPLAAGLRLAGEELAAREKKEKAAFEARYAAQCTAKYIASARYGSGYASGASYASGTSYASGARYGAGLAGGLDDDDDDGGPGARLSEDAELRLRRRIDDITDAVADLSANFGDDFTGLQAELGDLKKDVAELTRIARCVQADVRTILAAVQR